MVVVYSDFSDWDPSGPGVDTNNNPDHASANNDNGMFGVVLNNDGTLADLDSVTAGVQNDPFMVKTSYTVGLHGEEASVIWTEDSNGDPEGFFTSFNMRSKSGFTTTGTTAAVTRNDFDGDVRVTENYNGTMLQTNVRANDVANGIFTPTATYIRGEDGGGAMIAWVDDHNQSVRAQFYDANGEHSQAEIELIPSAGSTHGSMTHVKATTLEDGNILTVNTAVTGVELTRFDTTGTVVAEDYHTVNYSAWFPDVGALRDGGYIFAYASDEGIGNPLGVNFRRFDEDDNQIGGVVQFDTSVDPYVIPIVAGLENGGWAIAWTDRNVNPHHYVQAWREDGSTYFANHIQITSTSGTVSQHAHVTGLSDGGFATIFTDRTGAGTASDDVFIRTWSPDTVASVTTTTGADTVYANYADDTITGLGGDDYLFGDGGDDDIMGDAGADTLWGSSGEDTLSGGSDQDVLYGGFDDDLLDGGSENDTLEGGRGNDTLSGAAGDDLLDAGRGADVLYGGDGADTLFGADGADLMYGNTAADSMLGGDGDDTLFGGDGNDTLVGGMGADTLSGGLARDVFVFDDDDGVDVVADFDVDTVTGDVLQLDASLGITSQSALDAIVSDTGADLEVDFGDGQVITLIGVADASDLVFGTNVTSV